MEPDGILKAWITKVRMKRARTRAITIASTYSRKADLVVVLGIFVTLTVPERVKLLN